MNDPSERYTDGQSLDEQLHIAAGGAAPEPIGDPHRTEPYDPDRFPLQRRGNGPNGRFMGNEEGGVDDLDL
jgi:hypothetical protein